MHIPACSVTISDSPDCREFKGTSSEVFHMQLNITKQNRGAEIKRALSLPRKRTELSSAGLE